MPTYKLTYFNGRGRAEISRLIFAQAGVEYEDVRLKDEEWPKMQPTTPFGEVPLLEVDGLVLTQSIGIARYLAKTFGLTGKTALEDAQADEFIGAFEDLVEPCVAAAMEKDEKKKAELSKKFRDETLPKRLAGIEKLIKGDYLVGDKMTWADLHAVHSLTWSDLLQITINYDKLPKLKAIKDRVEASPKIAAWLETRPKTFF